MDRRTWRQAAHGPAAQRQRELARHEHAPGRPGDHPRASWVMGHSARWHDPDLLAELRMHELAQQHRDATVLAARAGRSPAAGGLIALRTALRMALRLFRRRPRR